MNATFGSLYDVGFRAIWGKAVRAPLYLALLLFSCSGLRAASVDPSVLDNAVYRVGQDEALIMQVEGAGTAPCSRNTPVGATCYCNKGVRRGHPVPGWTASTADLTNDGAGHYMRPGWHVSATKGMHGGMKFCHRDQ